MDILLIAYSFGAGKGSEPGVGWNAAVSLIQRGHHVTVITTDEFTDANTNAAKEFGTSLSIREWSCGLSGYALAKTYRRWQKLVAPKVRQLVREQHFDVIHQVNFNQYRYINFVQDCGLPYLAGPLGGGETVPFAFMGELSGKLKIKELIRYIGADALPCGWKTLRSKNRGMYLSSTPQTHDRLKKWAGIDSVTTPIIAVGENEIRDAVDKSGIPPFILAAGRVIPEKGMVILLRALAILWEQGVKIPLHIAGIATSDQRAHIDSLRAGYNLPPHAVVPLPMLPRNELMDLMAQSRAFIYPAFRDSGSMAVLEALAVGTLPVCFDIGSQSWLPEQFSVKVPVRKKLTVNDLAAGIKQALERETNAETNLERVSFVREKMTWRSRAELFEHCYLELQKP